MRKPHTFLCGRLCALSDIFGEIAAERIRAHEKHGDTSMESSAPDTLRRLAILTEEVGEVAKEFNDAEHDGRPVDLVRLRKELIQVAAMAAAWADVCDTDGSSSGRIVEKP